MTATILLFAGRGSLVITFPAIVTGLPEIWKVCPVLAMVVAELAAVLVASEAHRTVRFRAESLVHETTTFKHETTNHRITFTIIFEGVMLSLVKIRFWKQYVTAQNAFVSNDYYYNNWQ